MIQLLWKILWQFRTRFFIHIPHGHASPLVGIYSGEMKGTPHTGIYVNIHSGFSPNSQKMKTIQASVSHEWINNFWTMYIQKGTAQQWKFVSYCYLQQHSRLPNHCAQGRKCDSIRVTFRERHSYGDRGDREQVPGLGLWGVWLQMGTREPLAADSGGGYMTVQFVKIHQTIHIKVWLLLHINYPSM